ncbi:MAG: DUF4199 domain-containing protein [Chitinophagaceae bacterium]|nr:MAG: DUF4199 domain-containing protein [Chitinophagaceae bacterium]
MKLTATYKGLITGIVMVLVSLLLFYGFKIKPGGPTQLVVIGIFIAGVLWSVFSVRKKDTDLSFKNYFSEGFKTFVVMTLIIVLYTALFYKLNPELLEAVIKENEALVAKMGDKTPAEIAANSEKVRSIFMPMTISLTTVTYLLFGTVTSVVAGLFLKAYRK